MTTYGSMDPDIRAALDRVDLALAGLETRHVMSTGHRSQACLAGGVPCRRSDLHAAIAELLVEAARLYARAQRQ